MRNLSGVRKHDRRYKSLSNRADLDAGGNRIQKKVYRAILYWDGSNISCSSSGSKPETLELPSDNASIEKYFDYYIEAIGSIERDVSNFLEMLTPEKISTLSDNNGREAKKVGGYIVGNDKACFVVKFDALGSYIALNFLDGANNEVSLFVTSTPLSFSGISQAKGIIGDFYVKIMESFASLKDDAIVFSENSGEKRLSHIRGLNERESALKMSKYSSAGQDGYFTSVSIDYASIFWNGQAISYNIPLFGIKRSLVLKPPVNDYTIEEYFDYYIGILDSIEGDVNDFTSSPLPDQIVKWLDAIENDDEDAIALADPYEIGNEDACFILHPHEDIIVADFRFFPYSDDEIDFSVGSSNLSESGIEEIGSSIIRYLDEMREAFKDLKARALSHAKASSSKSSSVRSFAIGKWDLSSKADIFGEYALDALESRYEVAEHDTFYEAGSNVVGISVRVMGKDLNERSVEDLLDTGTLFNLAEPYFLGGFTVEKDGTAYDDYHLSPVTTFEVKFTLEEVGS